MGFIFKIFKFILWIFLILFGIGFVYTIFEKLKKKVNENGVCKKSFIQFIPGYRSNKNWKKWIATFYYVFTVIMLIEGFSMFLFFLSIPFLVTSIIGLFKAAKNKTLYKPIAILCVISLIAFIVALETMPDPQVDDIAGNNSTITSQEESYQDDELENDMEESKEGEKDTEVKHTASVDNENKSSDSSLGDAEKSSYNNADDSSSVGDNSLDEPPKETTVGESSSSSNNGNPSNANFEDKSETDKEFQYVGNSSTKKFHYTYCGSAEKISEGNRAYFNSRDEAINKGYVPCKRCNP